MTLESAIHRRGAESAEDGFEADHRAERVHASHLSPASASLRCDRPDIEHVGRMFEVRWNSLRPQGHSSGNTATLSQISFVLRIEIINCEHAIVEAWMEADAARRTVLERQPRRIEVSCDDRYLHVEVVDDHADESAAIASMTVARGMNDGASDRLVYVHTSLLRQAGFSAGTCERAALVRQSVAEVEKVSA